MSRIAQTEKLPPLAHRRRERSWVPTFSSFTQAFAQIRSSAAVTARYRLGRQGQGKCRALPVTSPRIMRARTAFPSAPASCVYYCAFARQACMMLCPSVQVSRGAEFMCRRSEDDPLAKFFFNRYRLHLLAIPREGAAVGDCYVVTPKGILNPGPVGQLMLRGFEMPEIAKGEAI